VREFLCRVELDTEITEPLCSHANDKYSSPVAEQTNVILVFTLAVTLLGSMVTIGGDTKKYKIFVNHTHVVITT